LDVEYEQKIEAKILSWINDEKWPTPTWLTSDDGAKKESYKRYFLRYLRNHYMAVETDFRSVLPAYISPIEDDIHEKSVKLENLDENTSQIIFDHLQAVRGTLQQSQKDIDNLMASTELDFLERGMIWIYPPHLLSALIPSLHFRLKTLEPAERDYYNNKLKYIIDKYDMEKDASLLINENITELYAIRSFLDQLIGACNQKTLDGLIDTGLQIERLKALRDGGLCMLLTFLILSPFILNSDLLSGGIYVTSLIDPHFEVIQKNSFLKALLSSVIIVLIGAIGGFLSGLIDIRSSTTNLGKYHESILTLELLKPLVGGFAALIVYVLLSWNILSSSVKVENPGIYILIAFISGFSERYFFRLLKLEIEPSQNEIEKT
jgi:hypothetical protein